MSVRLLGIAGSLREHSHNRRLLQHLAVAAPDGINLTLFDGLGDVPLFNEDLESSPMAAGVISWWEAARAADGLVFATPEYNQSLQGVLKNAIDWLTRDPRGSSLRGKPVAVTGATVGLWGTRLAQQQLRTVLVACGARVMPNATMFTARAGTEEADASALAAYMDAVQADLGKRDGGPA